MKSARKIGVTHRGKNIDLKKGAHDEKMKGDGYYRIGNVMKKGT